MEDMRIWRVSARRIKHCRSLQREEFPLASLKSVSSEEQQKRNI